MLYYLKWFLFSLELDMKFNFRFIILFVLLINCFCCFASCSEEVVIEDSWTDEYEIHLKNEYSIISEVAVRDFSETRQISVYAVCPDSTTESVVPVLLDFYNYIFNENTELRDIIFEKCTYLSISFQIKDEVILKYVCNYPVQNKDKWTFFVNNEFDSYYFFDDSKHDETLDILK